MIVRFLSYFKIKYLTWRKFYYKEYKLFFPNTFYFLLYYVTNHRHEVDTYCLYDYDNSTLFVSYYNIICCFILYF